MTLDEMAVKEQEHKDRIANMQRDYENGFVERAAGFIAEKKRLEEEIAKKQIELKETELAIATKSATKNELDSTISVAKATIAGLTKENFDLIEANASSAAEYGRAKAQREDTIKALSDKCDLLCAGIAEKEGILQSLDKDCEELKAELLSKQSEAAEYLAKLAANVNEAEAKAEAANAECILALGKAEAATARLNDELKVMADLEPSLVAKKTEVEELDKAIAQKKEELVENGKKFRELNALRDDLMFKQQDLKFREEQVAKKKAELDKRENQLKSMIGG